MRLDSRSRGIRHKSTPAPLCGRALGERDARPSCDEVVWGHPWRSWSAGADGLERDPCDTGMSRTAATARRKRRTVDHGGRFAQPHHTCSDGTGVTLKEQGQMSHDQSHLDDGAARGVVAIPSTSSRTRSTSRLSRGASRLRGIARTQGHPEGWQGCHRAHPARVFRMSLAGLETAPLQVFRVFRVFRTWAIRADRDNSTFLQKRGRPVPVRIGGAGCAWRVDAFLPGVQAGHLRAG